MKIKIEQQKFNSMDVEDTFQDMDIEFPYMETFCFFYTNGRSFKEYEWAFQLNLN